jgi:hypothetical protein
VVVATVLAPAAVTAVADLAAMQVRLDQAATARVAATLVLVVEVVPRALTAQAEAAPAVCGRTQVPARVMPAAVPTLHAASTAPVAVMGSSGPNPLD